MTKKILSFLENVCAVCLCILTFSVFFQILARLVFHIPATWTVETVSYTHLDVYKRQVIMDKNECKVFLDIQ